MDALAAEAVVHGSAWHPAAPWLPTDPMRPKVQKGVSKAREDCRRSSSSAQPRHGAQPTMVLGPWADTVAYQVAGTRKRMSLATAWVASTWELAPLRGALRGLLGVQDTARPEQAEMSHLPDAAVCFHLYLWKGPKAATSWRRSTASATVARKPSLGADDEDHPAGLPRQSSACLGHGCVQP